MSVVRRTMLSCTRKQQWTRWAWTHPGVRAGHPGRTARQQGPDGSAARLHRGEGLLPALALPLPATWAGKETSAEDRACRVARGHRGALPRRVRSGAAPLGRVPRAQPGTADTAERRAVV